MIIIRRQRCSNRFMHEWKGVAIVLVHVINFAGVDVTANQEETLEHETFQLEYDDMSKRWYIRTMQDKYFTLQAGGGIQASEVRRYVIFCSNPDLHKKHVLSTHVVIPN